MPDDFTSSQPLDLDNEITLPGLRSGAIIISRFKLERCVGKGGMGEVWLAHDTTLDEDIALKLLPRMIQFDEQAVSDLKNETRSGRSLSHPNIVSVYEFYRDDDNVAISMEYVAGDTLSKLRQRQAHGVFTTEQLKAWTVQLLTGLDYAHRDKKVVHRDLKPSNILIDSATSTLKIADFGIARSLADSMSRVTISAHSRGTLCYMSPEQAGGRSANRLDDLYAVGATLYELLSGNPPFYQGDISNQIQKVPPTPLAERLREQGIPTQIPDHWESAIMRCLAKERAQRPQSAAEIIDLLGLASSGSPSAKPYEIAQPSATQPAAAPPPVPGPPPLAHSTPRTPSHATTFGRPQQYTTSPTRHLGTGEVTIQTSAAVVSLSGSETRTQRSVFEFPKPASGGTATPGATTTSTVKDKPKWLIPLIATLSVLTIASIAGIAFVLGNRNNKPKEEPFSGKYDQGAFIKIDKNDKVTPPPSTLVTTPDNPKANHPTIPYVAPRSNLPPPGQDWLVPQHFKKIQEAIDRAGPGQKILLVKGTFNERITLKPDIKLIGAGLAETIIRTDGRSSSTITGSNCKDVTVTGIGFQHESDDSLAPGQSIAVLDSSLVTFTDCAFSHAMRDGLTISGAATVTLNHCTFSENAEAGLKITGGATVTVAGCTFEKNDFGIVAELAESNAVITDSTFTSHTASGVEISDHARATLRKCKFTTNKDSALSTHDVGSVASLDDCDITDTSKYGLSASKGAALTVTNCRATNNLIGIVCDGAGNIELRDNTIEGSKNVGIILSADAKGSTSIINKNFVKNSAMFGLQIKGEGMIPDVSGNDLSGNGAPDIYLHNKAGGRYSKNTLRSVEGFLAETAGTDDPGAGPHEWAADNIVVKPGA